MTSRGKLGRALLRAVLVLAAFGARHFQERATYRSSVDVAFEGTAAGPGASAQLLALGRLRDVAFDSTGTTGAEVEPLGGQTFRIVLRDGDPDHVRDTCNRVGERVVAHAHEIFPNPNQGAISVAEQALARYIAGPYKALQASRSTAPRRSPPNDVERVRLQIERSRLQVELAKASAQAAQSDSATNPFSEGTRAPDPRLLRRRVAEIDGLLSASVSGSPPAKPTELDPLLDAVDRAPIRWAPTARILHPALRGVPERVGASGWQLVLVACGTAVAAAVIPALLGRRAAPRMLPDLAPVGPPSRASVASGAPGLAAPRTPSPVSLMLEQPALAPPSRRTPPRGVAIGSEPPAPLVPTENESPEESLMAFPVVYQVDPAVVPDRYVALSNDLRPLCSDDCFVIAVVGSRRAASEKPKVAAGVALALSRDPATRVLLLDADPARPELHRLFHVETPPESDLVSQLTTRVGQSAPSTWYVAKCSASLHLLPSVRALGELILSTHFEACVQSLRTYYDFIVVNGPCTEERPACHAIDDIAEGVLWASAADEPDPRTQADVFTTQRLSVVVPAA